MDDNLISLNKLYNDVKSMNSFSIFFNPEKKIQLKEIESKILHISNQIESFNKNFSDNGWCAYDTIDLALVESANKEFDLKGIYAAEKLLVDYYKNEIKNKIPYLKARSITFSVRYELIQNAFNDHFEGRYYASVPLFLIIIDGAVNDFTCSKGFFAEGTDVSAWDCLVGCSEGLIKLKNIYNKGRNKTNTDEIFIPYRNGILHGRDLNYANEFVSCKCVALLFALSDWMSLKSNESQRRNKLEKELNPPSLSESIQKIQQSKIDKDELSKWKPRVIIVGSTIKSVGNSVDFINYPYLLPLLEMFEAWKNKNYGRLSVLLKNMFPYEQSEKKRAGECRDFFQNLSFISYELKEVEERGCSLTRILVQVTWEVGDNQLSEDLVFGCIYQDINGDYAFPWRSDGTWIIYPWDVKGLYRS